MATTSYGVNHPLARKAWAKKLFHEALRQTYIYRFLGTGKNSLCQIQEDLKKDKGDRVRQGLRMNLTGDGVQGDETQEGNEEALTTYSDDIFIDQLRHAVRSAGKMSEQRVPFSVREENRMGLQDWWSDRLDTWFFNQLAGNTGQTDTKYTGNQAAIAPTTAQHLMGSGTSSTEASLSPTANQTFLMTDIDRCITIAKTMTPMIRPIRIKGGDYYAMFIHPNVVNKLRAATTQTGAWADIQKAAIQGGEYTDNPIFSGALGMWNNTILHESTRLPIISGTPNSGTAGAYRRSVFCGAQSACMAFGRNSGPGKMDWNEDTFDYGNQLGVSAGMIAGLKKTVFNSADFGTIVVSSWAPPVT